MIKNNFLIKKTHNLIFRQLLTFCHSVHYTDVRNYYLINFIYLKNFLFHDINKKHFTLILFEKAYTIQVTYYIKSIFF